MRRKKISDWLPDEKALAKIVIEFLEKSNYDTYQEVKTINGYCDIIGIKEELVYSIETKLQFSFDVLEQARENIKISNYSYIAIPFPKKGRLNFKCEIAKMLGIGVIAVYSETVCKVILEPKYNEKIKRAVKLKEWQKLNEAGGKERLTDYKVLVKNIHEYLTSNGSTTLKELYDNLDSHYASYNSFRGAFTKYIKTGIISTLEIIDGKVILK